MSVNKNQQLNYQSGYIALVVTVIITAVLLILSASISMTGYMGRFSLLGYENRKASYSLAEGCTEYARLKLAQNHTYSPQVNGDSATLTGGTCKVCQVSGSGGVGSQRNVITRSKAGKSVTNISAVITLEVQNASLTSLQETAVYGGVLCPI